MCCDGRGLPIIRIYRWGVHPRWLLLGAEWNRGFLATLMFTSTPANSGAAPVSITVTPCSRIVGQDPDPAAMPGARANLELDLIRARAEKLVTVRN